MPMKTELPDERAGQVPMGGWSAAKARGMKPDTARPPAAPSPRRMKSRRLGLDLLMLSSSLLWSIYRSRLYRAKMLPQEARAAGREERQAAAISASPEAMASRSRSL